MLSQGMREDISYIGIRKVYKTVPGRFLLVPDATEKFGILQADRNNHFYTIGQSGTGKTTLLRNLILQDIEAGRGAILIDPHGDLASELIDFVPKSRTQDIVYFDPSDFDFPIGINCFNNVPEDPAKRALAVEQIVSIFRHVWDLADAATPRLLYVLEATIAALVEAPGTSLLGVKYMLTDRDFRLRVLKHVSDQENLKFWEEFDSKTNREREELIGSTLNKAGRLNASPVLRHIVGQKKSKLDFRFLMDNKRIVICNLSKGKIGEGGSNLLGAMILIQIYMAALARADQDEQDRAPCHVYVDEFQNFGSSSVFEDMLSESRKYGLKLTLAHQFMSQVDRRLQDAVLGNVGTIVCFRVGSRDAEILAREFEDSIKSREPHDFSELDTHHVLVRLQEQGARLPSTEGKTLPPFGEATGQGKSIVGRCRMHYAQPRERVQKGIEREFGVK